jgi:hypothetical protein
MINSSSLDKITFIFISILSSEKPSDIFAILE